MTAKIIISAVNPEETRMGIVENGRLMEYVVERNNSLSGARVQCGARHTGGFYRYWP